MAEEGHGNPASEEMEEEAEEEEEEGMAAWTVLVEDDDDGDRGGDGMAVSIGGSGWCCPLRTGRRRFKRGVSHVNVLGSEKIFPKNHDSPWFTFSPSAMDVVTYSAIRNRARIRARRKLEDDAVATSILGWLCAQVPEVFQTHVMPHLTDRDLLSLAFSVVNLDV